MAQPENDLVLGTSAYKNGIRATTFTPRDKGVGYLVGATDDPQIARSAYVDGPAAELICQRARALRIDAGRLTGAADDDDGEDLDVDQPTAVARLLADVLEVVPAREDRAWSETICQRLASHRPAVYTGWAPEQLAAALKPYGIDTTQINMHDPDSGTRANRKGIRREWIVAALNDRLEAAVDR